jgi:hypothetical protein
LSHLLQLLRLLLHFISPEKLCILLLGKTNLLLKHPRIAMLCSVPSWFLPEMPCSTTTSNLPFSLRLYSWEQGTFTLTGKTLMKGGV